MLIADALRQRLGNSAVLTGPAEVSGFTEDWRGRYRGPAACVTLPSHTGQVAQIVRLCAAQRVPIVAQGGNTSLVGGAVPDAAGPAPVIVSLQRMRRIRAIDVVSNTICVDAGCVLAAVQQAAEEADRLYPVSLGAEGSCQIGGTIATNAGGTGVLRYGNTRDNVLGLEVVLPDGTIWDGLYGLRKNNTGYDLKHLFIGSEGTLGIITGAVLKLHTQPGARAVAWLGVSGPRAALDLLGLFRARCEALLSAFELMNDAQIRMVLDQMQGRRCPITTPAAWHILVELSDTGEQVAVDQTMHAALEEAHASGVVADAAVATSDAQRAAMWLVRHSVSEANKKGGVGLTSDCAVPVSAVPAFIASATAAVREIVPEIPVIVVSHLGDGNVHFIPFFMFAAWDAVGDKDAMAAQIRRAINDVAVRLGGSFSAEHGIGQVLVPEMARYKPPVELKLMWAIKRALDPRDLFNPGRLLPAARRGTRAHSR